MERRRWTLLTGGYPPDHGGVSDYTCVVAHGLHAAGDEVTVWAPGPRYQRQNGAGVTVQRVPAVGGAMSVRALCAGLRPQRELGRLLVQYAPHAFGRKAMNLPFCLWLLSVRRRSPWVMFHEVAYPFARRQPLAHNILATVTHLMALIVAAAAERIFVSVPAWASMLEPLLVRKRPVHWLPVPSNLPTSVPAADVQAVRSRLLPVSGTALLGHFGTFGEHTSGNLWGILPMVLGRSADRVGLLIGRGSEEFARRLIARHPRLATTVHATGSVDASTAAAHIAACDVLLQPYVDGVSSRRTTTMAGLALGRPIVTTDGALTDPIWRETTAVRLVPAGCSERFAHAVDALLADPDGRRELGARAVTVYGQRFSAEHVVHELRTADSR